MLKPMLMLLLTLPAPVVAAGEDEKQRERRVCKREVAIGSLVQSTRTCLTKREWKQSRQHNRRTVDEWQNSIDGAQRGG
jgi:hypothetical protein